MEQEPSTSESNGTALSFSEEFDANFVRLAAEQMGIPDLTQEAVEEISSHVAFTVAAVMKMAKAFRRHAHRRWLTPDDVESALAHYDLPPLFCYDPVAKLAGYKKLPSQQRLLGGSEVELMALLSSQPPKLPLDATIRSFWLVIDGRQPAIPENPTPPPFSDSGAGDPDNSADAETSQQNAHSGWPASSILLSQLAKSVKKTEQVQIRTTTTHAISAEQQIFFKEVTEAVVGNDETRRLEALNCLSTDPGLQALVPRFSLTVHEGVKVNIGQHNLALLIYLMRMVQELHKNPAISLERSLHELIPSTLSCILCKQLSQDPNSLHHWTLREFSARLLASLVKKYTSQPTRPRVINTLLAVFHDQSKPMQTQYGAGFALNELEALTGEENLDHWRWLKEQLGRGGVIGSVGNR